VVATPSIPKESKPEPAVIPTHDAPGDSAPAGQAIRDEPPKAPEIAEVEKEKLRPLMVTFRDGLAEVTFSVSYHTEPTDAPLALSTFGDPSRVPAIFNSRVGGIVLAELEPLSLRQTRTRRAQIERDIGERLRVEFKKMGITIDSFSLTEIEPR
jgi:hypothetical protein